MWVFFVCRCEVWMCERSACGICIWMSYAWDFYVSMVYVECVCMSTFCVFAKCLCVGGVCVLCVCEVSVCVRCVYVCLWYVWYVCVCVLCMHVCKLSVWFNYCVWCKGGRVVERKGKSSDWTKGHSWELPLTKIVITESALDLNFGVLGSSPTQLCN